MRLILQILDKVRGALRRKPLVKPGYPLVVHQRSTREDAAVKAAPVGLASTLRVVERAGARPASAIIKKGRENIHVHPRHLRSR